MGENGKHVGGAALDLGAVRMIGLMSFATGMLVMFTGVADFQSGMLVGLGLVMALGN